MIKVAVLLSVILSREANERIAPGRRRSKCCGQHGFDVTQQRAGCDDQDVIERR